MEFMNDRLNDFDNYPFGNPSIIISTLITVRDKLEISNYNLNTLVKQINQCNIQSTPWSKFNNTQLWMLLKHNYQVIISCNVNLKQSTRQM